VKRIRFTIATLLVLVVFLGISFAALREATAIWDGAILSVTIGAMLVSILLSICCAGAKRAFWLGFALFGSTYLGLTVIPSIEPRLLTTQALVFLDSKVPGRPKPAVGQTWGGPSNGTPIIFQSLGSGGGFVPGSQVTFGPPNAAAGGAPIGWRGSTENFIKIAQSLLALFTAWSGGLLSRCLYLRAGHDG
jgi:hypothetical protein